MCVCVCVNFSIHLTENKVMGKRGEEEEEDRRGVEGKRKTFVTRPSKPERIPAFIDNKSLIIRGKSKK